MDFYTSETGLSLFDGLRTWSFPGENTSGGNITIYVAKTGSDDSGDGSDANPFLTIGRAEIEGLKYRLMVIYKSGT